MSETDLLTRPAPVAGHFDDDLIHTVCRLCDRALCDGGPCNGLDLDDWPEDELCVVCEDLDERLDACPHCGFVDFDST